jgi:hypothetical protein
VVSAKDLSEIETSVDNLARVNLMLADSGCANLKSYCKRTFEALVIQVSGKDADRKSENV